MIGIDTKLDGHLRAALAEDIAGCDLTSSLVPAHTKIKADAIVKQEAILCGLPIAERLFRIINEDVRFLPAAKDGDKLEKGRVLFYVEGDCRSILAAERTALNFLAHMSAVATRTHAFVLEVKGTAAKILDTRKTTPLFRILDRYAVRVGGGTNHRGGLYDGVLIKDNHLKAMRETSIEVLAKLARQRSPKKTSVGVEVKELNQLPFALASDVDYILLDNFSISQVKEAMRIRKDAGVSIAYEVSGGITLKSVRGYADCGVERISVGCLTHSIEAVDISLNLI